MGERPWTTSGAGVLLSVRLAPRGGGNAIDGIEALSDGRPVLKVRVRAAPSEGEANASLLKLLAHAAGVPLRAVSLRAGATARIKRIAIDGDAAAIVPRLEKIVASG